MREGPARMRPRGAGFDEIGEIVRTDDVFEKPGSLVPVLAFSTPRWSGEDLVAGLAAVCASCAATALAENDGVPRAAAGLADFGAECPRSGEDPADVVGGLGAPARAAARLRRRRRAGRLEQ